MKLLVITQKIDKDDDNLGFFHRWVEEFSRHVEKVIVIAGFVGKTNLPANVEVYSFGQNKNSYGILKLWKYWELVAEYYHKSDAVFFHMIPEYVLAASPFLLSVSRPSALWYVHRSVTWKLKLAEKIVDYIFTASELSFRLFSKKVIYTGHAIDTDFFKPNQYPNENQELKLLSVGRISPVKDYETILLACDFLLKTNWPRKWTLSIFGGPITDEDKNYFEVLKKKIEKIGLDFHVTFNGPRPYSEIPALYRKHDIFISVSRTGSIDKSVLEAMASGMSVITSNEAFAGILLYPYFLEKRTPESLAERIKIIADDKRPNIILRNIVIEKHSLKKTIKKIVDVLFFHRESVGGINNEFIDRGVKKY